MWENVRMRLGLAKQDDYIKEYIEDTNMRAIRYMCAFVIFVETWMILRIVRMTLFGGEVRSAEWIVVHLRLYITLLVSSIAMLWYALTYDRRKSVRSHGLTLAWKAGYTIICIIFGMYVSYLDYVKGEQIMSFITMVLFMACLLVWTPDISLILLSASFGIFYYACDKAVPATVATDVNMFTTWVAMVMISLGNYRQRLSEAIKDKGLEDISNHDDTTHIANMHHFREHAKKLLKSAAEEGRELVFIYFDIMNFKTYNERYGFSGGNELLTRMAEAIVESFPEGEAARLADDHFVVLADVDKPEKKIDLLQEKLFAYQGDVFLRLKAGIYRTNGFNREINDIEDINILCDRARFAVMSIKGQSDKLYCLYDEKLHESQRRRHYIVSQIDRAVKDGRIKVYYQPIIEAVTGRVCALEALARWNDPELGMLSPAEFIDTLEEYRQIHKLDACIIELVCRDYRDGIDHGRTLLPVSINLSRLDFELCDVAKLIGDLTDTYNVPRRHLEIEITESALSKNAEALDKAMNNLRISRHNLWLDDFGAGYSSFNVLKDYSFDVLKIDMKFLDDFGRNDRFEPILKSIINLCGELKMISLAEGVETQEEFDFLKENGCDRMQGYLFSKPVPLDELLKLFETGKLKA